jgi:hypothetical protein
MLLCGAAIGLGISAAWRAGSYLGVGVLALLMLLVVWGMAEMLRQGLRPPTAFERFEQRHSLRVILIVLGGGLGLALLKRSGYDTVVMLALPVLLAALLWSASRLRRKDETSAGYKARMRYRDPEQPPIDSERR